MTALDKTKLPRVCLGKIADAHGIKGLVKIYPYCENKKLLEGSLFTSKEDNHQLLISLKSAMGKYILAQIEDITDRDKALNLKNTELWLPREALPDLEEDEYYYEDLKGLDIVDSNKTKIGILLKVENFGAGDLFEIAPISGKSFYLPYTENTVLDINLKQKHITVFDGYKDYQEAAH